MTIFRALLVLSPLMSLAVAQTSPTCCPKSPTTGKEAVLWHKLETEVREIDARLDAVREVLDGDSPDGVETCIDFADFGLEFVPENGERSDDHSLNSSH